MDSALVVEDNMILAMEMERTLKRLGCKVVHSVPSVSEGLQHLQQKSDYSLAILDINLGELTSYERGKQIADLGIPKIFASGYDSKFDMPAELRHFQHLTKPIDDTTFATAICCQRIQKKLTSKLLHQTVTWSDKQMKQMFLRLVGNNDSSTDIVVGQQRFVIGRHEDADFRPSSDLVSRRHCVIHFSEGQFIIEDLDSRNGTFINGQRIDGKQIANNGCTLQLGRLLFDMIITPSGENPSESNPDGADLGVSTHDLQEEARQNRNRMSPPPTIDADRVLNRFFDLGDDSDD